MTRYFRLFLLSFYHIMGLCFLFLLLPLSFLIKRRKKRKNSDVIVVSSVAISYDGRIQKSLIKLDQYFGRVCLIKPIDTEEDPDVIVGFLNKIISKGRSGSYSYFPYTFDFFVTLRLLFSKESYVYCHDIPTCLMGFISSRISGKIFIADLHEWMSETIRISKTGTVTHLPFLKKWLYEYIERLVLKNAEYVISVSHDLSCLIKEKYGIDREILVIRNTGSILQEDLKTENFSVQPHNKEKLKLIYIGQINPHRNIENILNALQYCPYFSLLIQGTCPDDYKKSLINIIETLDIKERVCFLPPVPPLEVIDAIKKADIGIMSCKKFSKNLKNSLPNKVFEYIWAEIPFICENLPSVMKMTEESNFVKFFDSDNVESVIQTLKSIDSDFLETKQEIKFFKENLFSTDDFDQYKKIREG